MQLGVWPSDSPCLQSALCCEMTHALTRIQRLVWGKRCSICATGLSNTKALTLSFPRGTGVFVFPEPMWWERCVARPGGF